MSGLFSPCFRIATFKSAVIRTIVPAIFFVTWLSGCAIPNARPESSTRDKAFIEYWPPSNDSKKLRLAVKVSGMNAYYGTPRNPLDRGRIPGGSSSGSAVAVANDEADVAFGTDTAGSIRVPAACCGVVGLKTTFGLVPIDGVYPIAPNR